jgi:hypothetical protein
MLPPVHHAASIGYNPTNHVQPSSPSKPPSRIFHFDHGVALKKSGWGSSAVQSCQPTPSLSTPSHKPPKTILTLRLPPGAMVTLTKRRV